MNIKKLTGKFLAAALTAALGTGIFLTPSGLCLQVHAEEQAQTAEQPQTEEQSQAAQQIRSIYTNELIPASLAAQRPIAVMMPTDKKAQPSYGIGHAKVLYEIMEEGEMSRQMAIIDDWQSLPQIGNLRSCRDYYISLAAQWDAILIHFGGVYYMADRISASDIDNLSGVAEYGAGGDKPGAGYFYRTTDRKAPHNAYISGEGITQASSQLGYSLAVRPEYYNTAQFTFAEGVNTLEQYENALPGNVIDLSNIFTYTKSYFVYNPQTGQYAKNLHGAPQVDALSGEQLTFSNVMIQNTKWSKRDAKGYLAFQMNDTTSDGYYFTKGRGIHITWQKTADHSPTRYYDDNGNEVQINEGKTYIGIAQEGRAVMYS